MSALYYYTVYSAKTDEVVASGTAQECAKMMKRSLTSFYCTVGRTRSGKLHKYVIVADPFKDEDKDDERK